MSWLIVVIAVVLAMALSDGAHGFGLVVLTVVFGVLLRRQHRRIETLEAQVALLQQQPLRTAQAATSAPEDSLPDASGFEPETEPSVEQLPPALLSSVRAAPPFTEPPQPAATPTPAPVAARPAEVDERSASVTSSIGQSVLAWFRGGNAIVRAGAVILFIGVAFLLRFAAERATIPIELRLAGVALGGLALTVVGWRLRHTRRGYGISLQGAGIGVLYLVIFAGLRLYALLPAPLAFGLLVALSMITAVLAMLQDALALAVLAFSGGFLAPVFTSTGHGSHVALFSYYLVLNLGIAWIAARKAWKLLNLVGFAFTFVIGTAWGLSSYEPALFASTEAFLVLHFLLYLFVSVQYSRQLASEKNTRVAYVDGSLLFGVPIVAFGLQAGIVKHIPYGLAVSSAVLSGIYLLLGRWLWRHAGTQLKLLTEGLLALGLVFLVLVTPLALDARWTSAAWAVQGVGVLWVALRQQRGWAAAMGLLLQLAAAATFWGVSAGRDIAALLWLNAHLLGALILGVSALWSAWLLHRTRDARPWPDAPFAISAELIELLHWIAMVGGVVQVLLGLWIECDLAQAPQWDNAWRVCLLGVAMAITLELAQARLRWPELGVPARVLASGAVVMSALAVWSDVGRTELIHSRFTAGWGWLEAAAVIATAVWLQRRLARDDMPPWRASTGAEHLIAGWYVLLQGGLQLHALTAQAVARHEAWTPLAAIVLPTLSAWWAARQLARSAWPPAAHPQAWQFGLLMPWIALLGLWSLVVNLACDGSMQPLPYVPLLNPIDLGHVLVLLYALKLGRARLMKGRHWTIGMAIVAFAWLNGLLVRTLHHMAGTPMWLHGALSSSVVQTGLTILWTTLALLAMLYATRRAPPSAARGVWVAGAGLLAVVVLKLFVVDLSSVGTLERIVSFVAVGLLMLVIGYVSPMPPAAIREGQRPSSS